MTRSIPPYAVVDVETDGLDANKNRLLEIAVVVIDPVNLEPLADPFEATVYYPQLTVEWMKNQASDVVFEMHTQSGLWGILSNRKVASPLAQIDRALAEYLRMFTPRKMPVMGNSVRLDMNFMDVHLPLSAAVLDYHMRDVSSVAGFAADWYAAPYFEKSKGHRALADAYECIEELKHYRKHIFKVSGNEETDRLRADCKRNMDMATGFERQLRERNAQITEALAALVDAPTTDEGWSNAHAILSRGSQGAAEPTTSAEHDRDRRNDGEGIPVGAMPEPWTDPEPYVDFNGVRTALPIGRSHPRSREQFDAEQEANRG